MDALRHIHDVVTRDRERNDGRAKHVKDKAFEYHIFQFLLAQKCLHIAHARLVAFMRLFDFRPERKRSMYGSR